jgi:hypothetical protein
MLANGQDYPIAEMFIKGNEDPIFSNCGMQYLVIIGSGLADFRGT